MDGRRRAFFVCGDARRMGTSTQRCVNIQDKGKTEENEYVEKLKANLR
jgi:hypothetical protein